MLPDFAGFPRILPNERLHLRDQIGRLRLQLLGVQAKAADDDAGAIEIMRVKLFMGETSFVRAHAY